MLRVHDVAATREALTLAAARSGRCYLGLEDRE